MWITIVDYVCLCVSYSTTAFAVIISWSIFNFQRNTSRDYTVLAGRLTYFAAFVVTSVVWPWYSVCAYIHQAVFTQGGFGSTVA